MWHPSGVFGRQVHVLSQESLEVIVLSHLAHLGSLASSLWSLNGMGSFKGGCGGSRRLWGVLKGTLSVGGKVIGTGRRWGGSQCLEVGVAPRDR